MTSPAPVPTPAPMQYPNEGGSYVVDHTPPTAKPAGKTSGKPAAAAQTPAETHPAPAQEAAE